MNTKVSLVKCASYDPLEAYNAVNKALELLGGVSKFIKPGSKVLVKPNLLMAKEPECGIDTHPEVVRAAIKILKSIDCKIFVGDGPNVWGSQAENVDEVYERSGIKKITEEEGVSLVEFDKRRWYGEFPLTGWLGECDYLVSLPKFKTHEFTVLTGAVKNLFGLVCGTYKTELHKKYSGQEDFARMLVDLYEKTKPALTIIDGITAMEADGPATGGSLRRKNILLAGSDCVALDSVLALIMGIEPLDILSTKEAAHRGLGVADIKQIDILGERLKDVIDEPFKLPQASLRSRLPRPIIELAKKMIRFYPKIDYAKCIKCGSCIKACPKKVISKRNEKIVISYSGCISCFCCQEACPSSAIKVKKTLLAKLIGL